MAEDAKDDSIDAWPDTLQRLAAVIGRERTLELADRCGGLDRIYIPQEVTSSHYWVAVLGPDEWAKVVAVFGGERIDLPRGVFVRLRKREILVFAEQGMAQRQIAMRCRVSERYVRQVLESAHMSAPVDERQLKMF